MEVLLYLVPLAIMLGALGLAAFLWSLRNGQYDDLDGAAWRAIADDEPPETFSTSAHPASAQRQHRDRKAGEGHQKGPPGRLRGEPSELRQTARSPPLSHGRPPINSS